MALAQLPNRVRPTHSGSIYCLPAISTAAWPGRAAATSGSPAQRAGAPIYLLLARLIAQKKAALQALSGRAPLVLVAGSSTRPDVLGNHVYSQSDQTAEAANALIAALHPDAIAIGPYDFGAQRIALTRFLRGMSKAQIPTLAGNISCGEAGDLRCANPAAKLIDRKGLRVGLYAVVRRDLVGRILPGSASGIRSTDPVAFARRATLALKAQGAQLIIALASLNLESNSPGPVLDFARQLGNDAPDVIIADTLFERSSRRFISQLQLDGGPIIVGTDRFGQTLGQLTLIVDKTSGAVSARTLSLHPTHQVGVDEQRDRRAHELRRELCRAIDQPLGHARLTRPMDRPTFIRYVLEILRHHTGAELAAINDSALADTTFPLSGTLTREAILRTIRSETTIGTIALPGSQLVKRLAGKDQLHLLGLEKVGGNWQVNGRPLVGTQDYRVALSRFVAHGGDRLFDRGHYRFVERSIRLRRVVSSFFQADRQAAFDHTLTIDGRGDFLDASLRWVLHSEADVNFAFSNVTIDNVGKNGARYSRPTLTRDNITTLKAEAHLGLGFGNRRHSLEGDVDLGYGQTWTLSGDDKYAGKSAERAESLDQIKAALLYTLTHWRHRPTVGRWYTPIPYAELALTSEFSGESSYCSANRGTANETAASYHYLELTGTVGAGLLLHPALLVKLGFTVDNELVTPHAALEQSGLRRSQPGLFVGYTLRKVQLIADPRHPLSLSSRLDFSATSLASARRVQLTWQTKLLFALTRHLHLSVGHQIYAIDNRYARWSWSNDLSLGLTLAVDRRRAWY